MSDLVLPALRSFHKRYPAVSHELIVAGSDRIVRALVADDADLGVVFNPPELSDLTSIGHRTDALYAIMHPRHTALRMRKITLAEVVAYPLALPDQTFGLRHMLDAAAKVAGITLAPMLTTNSIEALRAFARVGIGMTILPAFSVTGDVRRRLLRTLPLAERELRVARTTILSHRGRQLPIAVTQFAEHLLGAANAAAR